MNNAVKYTFQGQIGISMKGYNLNEVQYLQVKIKDSGIGISDQHKPHLFKMFGLVDSTASNKKSGNVLIYIYIYIHIYIYIYRYWTRTYINKEYFNANGGRCRDKFGRGKRDNT